MSLGLSAYHNAGGGDFAPRVEYNAKSGRMHRVDRAQGADGAFASDKVDITRSQPVFALDCGSIEVGWLSFPPGGAPQTEMVPYGHDMPERPGPKYKAGFKVMIWNPQDLGPDAREFKSNAGVVVAAIEELWDQITTAPEAAAGDIPVVQLVDVKPVTGASGTNYAPDLQLLKWITRDERVFGPRTVAPPVVRNGHAVRQQPAHVPPAIRPAAPPARQPARQAPPDDRWGDAPPVAARQAGGGRVSSDRIPFAAAVA